jgi:hypothetical protein
MRSMVILIEVLGIVAMKACGLVAGFMEKAK